MALEYVYDNWNVKPGRRNGFTEHHLERVVRGVRMIVGQLKFTQARVHGGEYRDVGTCARIAVRILRAVETDGIIEYVSCLQN